MTLIDHRDRGHYFEAPAPHQPTVQPLTATWPKPDPALADAVRVVIEGACGVRPLRQVAGVVGHPRVLSYVRQLSRRQRRVIIRRIRVQITGQRAEVSVVCEGTRMEAWASTWERHGARWKCLHLTALHSVRP